LSQAANPMHRLTNQSGIHDVSFFSFEYPLKQF
jgi:hypothetical protein